MLFWGEQGQEKKTWVDTAISSAVGLCACLRAPYSSASGQGEGGPLWGGAGEEPAIPSGKQATVTSCDDSVLFVWICRTHCLKYEYKGVLVIPRNR